MGAPVPHPRSAIVAAMLVLAGIGCAADSASEESAPLIEYRRSGGIRGTTDRLVIDDDGTATRTRGGTATEITLEPRVMDRLRRILRQIDWSTLQREYVARSGTADMYEYTLIHRDHTVRAEEAALPETLYPLIELLDGMLDGS